MGELYKKHGTSADTSLLADVENASRIGIAVYPGEGELDRGAILAKDAVSGMYKAAVSGALSGKILAVLDEAVDAGASATGVGVSARAYERGIFIKEKVSLATGTLASADIVPLVQQGIFLRVSTGALDIEVP